MESNGLSGLFQTMQINGQRKITNLIKNSGDGEGHEVFIGHLPRDVLEKDLMPILQAVGKVMELRIMMNFSGLTRGFAFAKYNTEEAAKNAVEYLNGFEIRPGCKIAVVESMDNRKLFIGRIPSHFDNDTITSKITTFTKNVVKMDFRLKEMNGNIYRSCIVEYLKHSDACDARRVLIPNSKTIFSDEVLIDWALVRKPSKSDDDKPEKKRRNHRNPSQDSTGRPIYGGQRMIERDQGPIYIEQPYAYSKVHWNPMGRDPWKTSNFQDADEMIVPGRSSA